MLVTKGTGLGRDRLHKDDYSLDYWSKEGNAAISLVRNMSDNLILSSNQSSDLMCIRYQDLEHYATRIPGIIVLCVTQPGQ